VRQLQRGMDLGLEEAKTNARYTRILKAEFLKYTDAPQQPLEVVEPKEK